MENKKSNKGLVIFLIILVVLLIAGLGLLLGGVVKSPFVKEVTCKKCTCNKCNVKTKTEKKEETETRYYQFVSPYEEEVGVKRTIEIELNKDGTAKIAYNGISDSEDKQGIYVENDKYIVLELNNPNAQCTDDNYQPLIADVCTDNMILIKDNGVLKTQRGALLHFEIDNANNSTEFLQVKKSDLMSSLKN